MGYSRCSCGEHIWAMKARTRRRVDRPTVSAPQGRAHARTHEYTHARWLSTPTSGRALIGNNTTLLVALAAGFGGAFACSLVFGIVMILRNRRAARATDPAPGLRTPLYGE